MARCTMRNCKSDKPGLWEPIVLLWPKDSQFPANPANVNVVTHRICDDCVKRSQVQDFIPTMEHWNRIKLVFHEQKKAEPNIFTAKLSFMMPETATILRGDFA